LIFDFDFISIPLSRKRDAHQPLKQGYLIGCFENKLYLFTKHIISLITGFKEKLFLSLIKPYFGGSFKTLKWLIHST